MGLLKNLNLIKTIYFNLRMLPFKQALKMPLFIAYHTKFISLKGRITIKADIKPGMIRFGFGTVGVIDKKYTRTLIEINGIIEFDKKANFGYGSKISIGENGILKVGNNFVISANSTIICFNSITIGEDVLFSWEILVMDTDFHQTLNTIQNKVNLNISKPITIGKNSWVGLRCLILKGTCIPANTIVGAGSLLNKNYEIEENTLLAGNPAVPKKKNLSKI